MDPSAEKCDPIVLFSSLYGEHVSWSQPWTERDHKILEAWVPTEQTVDYLNRTNQKFSQDCL